MPAKFRMPFAGMARSYEKKLALRKQKRPASGAFLHYRTCITDQRTPAFRSAAGVKSASLVRMPNCGACFSSLLIAATM
ncbi:hypothetical protein D3C76_688070 [compost metagenome]